MKNILSELKKLINQLEANECSQVIIAPKMTLDWNSLQAFKLKMKGIAGGIHYFGSIGIPTVELIGSKEDFRMLGLLLIISGLSCPKKDIYLQLISHKKSTVNAIMINKINSPPDFFGLIPYAVNYKVADISSSYPRCNGCEEYYDLPSFGIIDESIHIRTDFEVPSWVNHAITFSNSANSCLRLGKLLLDFSHPSNTIDELHLEPANRVVSPVSYEARFWLPGSFGDDDAYR